MSRGQTLVCLGDWLRESLVRQSCWEKSPGSLDILQEGNPKGTGAGCPHRPKVDPEGKKTSLTEQRALSGTQEKKEKIMTSGRRGRPLRRTTRLL